MKVRMWAALVVVLLCVAGIALAGMSVTMQCKSCGFSSNVKHGGGFQFEQVGGYCMGCEKFVYVSWKRGEERPSPLCKAWDSSSGKTIPLYKCPECKKPFMLFQPEMKHCPKCGKPTLEHDQSDGTLMYD